MRKILVFLSIILVFVSTTNAWDDAGHKLAAYIAWQKMTPATREKALKILLSAPEDSDLSVFYLPFNSRSDEAKKLEFFMIVATWADMIKDRKFKNRYEKYNKSNWHYADTFWRQENGQVKIVEDSGEDEGKGVEKLYDFEKVLKDKDASDADKAIALAWILHIGGDLHQPLHTSARITDLEPKGDQGGNLFLLTPKDTPRERSKNLHSFWDGIVVSSVPRQSDACDSEYLPPIGNQFMRKYPLARMQNRLAIGNFDKWQQDSFSIATKEVFPSTLIRFQTPSQNYKRKAFQIAEEQIALAGYRLATMLNQILDNQAPVAANFPCRIIRKVMYPISKKRIANQTMRIALLNTCPENQGMIARPVIPVNFNGQKTVREFDVIRVFENQQEAEKFARENNLTDVEYN